MKEYKLKQRYPNLPKHVQVGDIVPADRNGHIIIAYRAADSQLESSHILFRDDILSDFWELIKKEKPLLITKDEVEIYSEEAKLYVVHKDDFKVSKRHIKDILNTRFEYLDNYIVFEDKVNAYEYIWRNKPVFSYEDFMRWGNVPYERVIKELAMERIEEL